MSKSFLLLILALLAINCKAPVESFKDLGDDIIYVGVNDHEVDLFEGQYPVKNGISYNSYIVVDTKSMVFDTVDVNFADQWLDNIRDALKGKSPDYLLIQHMEPDHSGSIDKFLNAYPQAIVISSKLAFTMMKGYFGFSYENRRQIVKEGDTFQLGKHTFAFVEAPMVHWPEVIVTYDTLSKTLFSADGFGKFGALDVEEPWDDESRRYFIGIVGKYGPQVQALLQKASGLEIKRICPTHGPILTENLGHYLDLYTKWSTYTPEEDGIVIAYTSVYGHTKVAVTMLAEKLQAKGKKVVVYDLARDNFSFPVADAFRYSKLVLATTTYNMDIFPFMKTFINHLIDRNFQNRTVGIIENGTWGPQAAKKIKDMFKGSKDITFTKTTVTVKASVSGKNIKDIDDLMKELL